MKPKWVHPGQFPRVYDVDGEGLYFRFRDGDREIWVPISWPEARTFYDDLHDAIMRRARAVESGYAEPCSVAKGSPNPAEHSGIMAWITKR